MRLFGDGIQFGVVLVLVKVIKRWPDPARPADGGVVKFNTGEITIYVPGSSRS